MNRLYYGDCLEIMNGMKLSSVDLIYLDPPFNSNRSYNAIYKDKTGMPLPEQVEAFCDIWVLNEERERAIRAMPVLMRDAGIDDSAAALWKLWMNALRNTQPQLLAYLSYMSERLIVMKGIMKPTASIYFHCDPTASHYIKSLMDAIFGHQNFQNEIIWHYRRWTGKAKRFQRLHDVILFYSKSDKYKFNVLYTDYTQGSKSRKEQGVLNRFKDGEKIFVSYKEVDKKGVRENDVWQIPFIVPSSKERLGYPTQKPLSLMRKIILASSDEGDVILDPFCGCATTICAAHELNRKWIGIDIAYHAIKRVVQVRLADHYRLVEGNDYKVDGIPKTEESATDLWRRDKYQFQRWAVEMVDGFVTTKRTNDGGIDGRIYISIQGSENLASMIVEVKGGENIGIGVIRELRGVMERSGAEMAGLIVRTELGETKKRNFVKEMASAGDLDVMGKKYPRIQILTVSEILEGNLFNTPSVSARGDAQRVLPLS